MMDGSALLVEFQTAATERLDAGHNRGWRVLVDGRVFTRSNQPDAARPPDETDIYWFERDYSVDPVQVLDEPARERLRQLLEMHRDLPSVHVKNSQMEHGARYRLVLSTSEGLRTLEADTDHRAIVLDIVRPILDLLRKEE